MPTDADFQRVFGELCDNRPGLEEMSQLLRKEWPDRADRRAFNAWLDARRRPLFSVSNLAASELVEKVDAISFLDDAAVDILDDEMHKDFRTWIVLGRIGECLYRLAPESYRLRPQVLELPPTNRKVLPESFLAVNLTVQPREPSLPTSRRRANMSEESTITAESDDVNSPGFVFYQLGYLEYSCYKVQDMPKSYEEAEGREWFKTGFNVVAELSRSGTVRSIYLVFDMFPDVDEESCDRSQWTGLGWGRLPSSRGGEQFSIARIGKRLGDFGLDVELELTDLIEHPVELVRVVLSADGYPLPIKVNRYNQIQVDE